MSFNIILLSTLAFPSDLIRLSFAVVIFYALLEFNMRCTCRAHLVVFDLPSQSWLFPANRTKRLKCYTIHTENYILRSYEEDEDQAISKNIWTNSWSPSF
jgi:hypothetical protein